MNLGLPFYNQILVGFINLVGIWLALMVFYYSPYSRIKKIFLGMVVWMCLWVDFAYLARVVGERNSVLALIFLKVAWFVTPLLFVFLYILGVYLLGFEKKYQKLTIGVVVIGGIASLITGGTDLVVKNIKFVDSYLSIVYGEGMVPFLGMVFFVMCMTLYLLGKGYFQSDFEKRKQIKYVLIGAFGFYLANIIFNIFFPLFLKIVRFYWIGDYSAIFLLGFVAYAVVKHHLFGVRVLFIWVMMFLAVSFFLVEVFALTQTLSWRLMKIGFLLVFIYFAFSLIKATELEIKAKENLKKAHQKLSVAYHKLKEIDRMKSEFLSITSHQLKGPLGTIRGYLWMMLNEKYGPLPKKLKVPLENIFKANERLVKVVGDLLNLSRIEMGKIKLEKKYFQIEEIVENIYKELLSEAEKKGLKFEFKKPKEALPKVFGDPLKIREAIFNVVDNAIKYTQRGWVKIEVGKEKDSVLIKVSDTGIGFSKEELKDLFKDFTRIKRGKVLYTQGSGLGLYIAKKFLQFHKGRIWAESEGEGKGATFYIQLPFKNDSRNEF